MEYVSIEMKDITTGTPTMREFLTATADAKKEVNKPFRSHACHAEAPKVPKAHQYEQSEHWFNAVQARAAKGTTHSLQSCNEGSPMPLLQVHAGRVASA